MSSATSDAASPPKPDLEKGAPVAVVEEDCKTWGMESEDEPTVGTKVSPANPGSTATDPEKKPSGSFGAMCVTAASIPGLVGTWCWPLLVAALMSIPWYDVDNGLSSLFYALELVFMAILSTNILQYGWWLNKQKKGTKKGAVRLLFFAMWFNLAHPLAVVCIYIGYGCKAKPVFPPGTKMWSDGSFVPNTALGIFFWVLRWIGTGLMITGIMQLTDLHKKIAKSWRKARTGQ